MHCSRLAGLCFALGLAWLPASSQAAPPDQPKGKSAEALAKDLDSADKAVRRDAAVALGGLRRSAEAAVPALVRVLANTKEDQDVRIQAAVALSRVGNVPVARDAIPTLIRVVHNARNPAEVRLRALWALRVHNQDLKNHPALFDTLAVVVLEPRNKDNRMLRYDAAFLLGVLQRDKAPQGALNVLAELLKDANIPVIVAVGRPPRDGRVMAVHALRYVGPDRLRGQEGILRPLRALQNSPDEHLRREVQILLDQLAR
jgi:hypothetical protein